MRKSVSLCKAFRAACRGPPFPKPAVPKATVAGTLQHKHSYSSAPEPYQFLNVKTDVQKGVAVVEMKKAPVNSLSLEFLTEMNIALEKLENDKSCRGFILTSTLPVFSAGLEITEMYQPQQDRLRTFWKNFQDVAFKLHSTSKVNIAAINGPAPAGGCAMSLACDFRVMADGKNIIGLNEALLGLVAPYWLRQLSVYVVGNRQSDMLLQRGTLFPAQEALKIGLVDLVVPQEKLLEVALQQMEQWLKVPDAGRQLSKEIVRKPFVEEFHRRRQEDEDSFVGVVNNSAIQKQLGRYLEAMRQKAK